MTLVIVECILQQLILVCRIYLYNHIYRKVHTESSKKWLDRLQVEKVPVLVCLTFADKLYAEHMKDGEYLTDESKYPDKISTKHKLQAELAVSYAAYCTLVVLLNYHNPFLLL